MTQVNPSLFVSQGN